MFSEMNDKKEIKGVNKSDFIELSSDVLRMGDFLVPPTPSSPMTHPQHRQDHFPPKGKGSGSSSVYKRESRVMRESLEKEEGPQ